MRSQAREAAFQVLFAELFNERLDARFAANVYKKAGLAAEDIAYAERLVSTVNEKKEELSSLLSEKVARFVEYRVYPADRAILYLALAEIKFFDDIPPIVSVNEAVALARKFSTENSVNFVNGVLGGVINDAH